MNPSRKIATLLMFLGPEISGELLKLLPKESARKLLEALANTGKVSDEDVMSVIQEFLPLLKSNTRTTFVSPDAGRKVLEAAKKSLADDSLFSESEEDSVLQEIHDLLESLRTEDLASWLIKERSQTIAAVLCIMEPEAGAKVFKKLPTDLQTDVALAIANMLKMDLKALEALRDELADLRKRAGSTRTLGGQKILADMLQNVNTAFRDSLLEKLEEQNPTLVESLKKDLLTLKRLADLAPQDLAKICASFSDKDLAIALKIEEESVRNKILSGVSSSRKTCILEEITCLGPTKKSDVEAVTKKIVMRAEQLHGEGKISFPWEDQLV